MAIRELKDQIARLPEQPGVYLYFNAAGDTIYVGKARALRDRVRNYLGASGSDVKTDALLTEIARLEVIVTDSVVEALALENNLIKQRSPKYNIRLRDDKNYPYLQLTTNEAFPRVLVARRFEEAAQMRDAMRTVQALHDRQQKMALAELGHRDVFGVKVGPAGVVVQVFEVRNGRVVERVELGTGSDDPIGGTRDGEVLAAALQQFYE